jgi:hypothetical protein
MGFEDLQGLLGGWMVTGWNFRELELQRVRWSVLWMIELSLEWPTRDETV